jgi:hypothetical protein
MNGNFWWIFVRPISEIFVKEEARATFKNENAFKTILKESSLLSIALFVQIGTSAIYDIQLKSIVGKFYDLWS